MVRKNVEPFKSYLSVFLSIALYHINFSLYVAALPAAMFEVGGHDFQLPFAVGSFAGGLGAARIFFRRQFMRLDATSLHRIANYVQFSAALLIVITPLGWAIALPRFLHGISCAFFSVALGLWISNKVPEAERGRFRGIEGVLIAVIMLAAPFGGLMIVQHANFGMVTAVALASAALACLVVIPQTPVSDTDSEQTTPFDRSFFFILGVLLAGGILIGSVETFFPALVNWKGTLTLGEAVLTFGMALIFGRGLGGVAADRWGRLIAIKLGSMSAAIGAACFHFSTDGKSALVFIALLSFGIGIFITAANTAISDLAAGKAGGGRLISDATLSLEAGQFVGPLLLGVSMIVGGVPLLSASTCVVAALAAGMAWVPCFDRAPKIQHNSCVSSTEGGRA